MENDEVALEAQNLEVDDLLRPGNARNGHREWHIEDVNIDQSIGRGFNGHARVNWPRFHAHLENPEPLDYFLRLFPVPFIENILMNTNEEIGRRRLQAVAGNDRNIQNLERWEFLRWIGIGLAIALERPRGSLQEIFSDREVPGSILRASNYSERFKMTFNRFRQINSVLRFSPQIAPGRDRVCKLVHLYAINYLM